MTSQLGTLEKSIAILRAQSSALAQKIQKLEAERNSSEQRAREAEQESQRRIRESVQRLEAQLDHEKATMENLADYKSFRELLHEAKIKPDDTQLMRRILRELKERGMDPAQVALQLAQNVTLAERNRELADGNEFLLKRKNELIREQRAAALQRDNILAGRDRLYNEAQDIKKQIEASTIHLQGARVELANALQTDADWKAIHQAIQESRNTLNQLGEEKTKMHKYLAPAYWLVSILQKQRPVLFHSEKEFVLKFFEENKHEQRYTDEIGQRIIELAANEVASRGGLVPKLQLSAAQAVAASRKQIINTFADALRKFIDDPAKMNIEQRRAFSKPTIKRQA